MRLSYVTIENYRSITAAYKINVSNFTVLIGKNNEGKTNIIRAITLCMHCINRMVLLSKNPLPLRNEYNWQSDFPVLLQNKKKNVDKCTHINLDFELNKDETKAICKQTKSNISNVISLSFVFSQDNKATLTILEKGKNDKPTPIKYSQICDFIHKNFVMQWIPAIRLEDDVIYTIRDLIEAELSNISNKKYLKSLKTIRSTQQIVLNKLAKKTESPLKKFLPNINNISLSISSRALKSNRFHIFSDDLLFEIDDGVPTKLENKGDGVKSLATIALLSQITSSKSRIIIVDEPENHLHPDAIRYIYGVLQKLSENSQVLISTHNPIFVNTNKISSNIIVEKGEATPANSLRDIRQTLGIICSDNLIFSDYVVIVEGKTDFNVISKLLESDPKLKKHLLEKRLCVKYTSGTDNLVDTVVPMNSFCCRYIVILDYDKAGRDAANRIRSKCGTLTDQIRFIKLERKKCNELEDLYVRKLYSGLLYKKYNLKIVDSDFKNPNEEWSQAIRRVALRDGRELSQSEIELIKSEISEKITTFNRKFFTKSGYDILVSIRNYIKTNYLGK